MLCPCAGNLRVQRTLLYIHLNEVENVAENSEQKEYISRSPERTEEIGAELSAELVPGDVIAFKGGMGVGKTCFVRGLARGLGFKGNTYSPTFAIVNEYSGGRLPLYHFDMYRINGWDDLYSTGFFDYLESGAVLAIEWSENIENILPKGHIEIEIEPISEDERRIKIRRTGK